jgi:hypothetical protein
VGRNLDSGEKWKNLPGLPVKWVSGGDFGDSAYKLLPIAEPSEEPRARSAGDVPCGRPAGHDGDHLPFTTVEDDLILASMPEKGGRATLCGELDWNRRTAESDRQEDR